MGGFLHTDFHNRRKIAEEIVKKGNHRLHVTTEFNTCVPSLKTQHFITITKNLADRECHMALTFYQLLITQPLHLDKESSRGSLRLNYNKNNLSKILPLQYV